MDITKAKALVINEFGRLSIPPAGGGKVVNTKNDLKWQKKSLAL